MEIRKFDEKEMTPIGKAPVPFSMDTLDLFDWPVGSREAIRLLYERKPVWQTNIAGPESMMFMPGIFPDNIARGMVVDAAVFAGKQYPQGGRDMFGIEWVYEPEAGGSMVMPGAPAFEDANDILETLQWPDVDSWDWEGCARENYTMLDCGKSVNLTIFTGWFERLISFMDFEGAALAMIDEDQQDAVKELFLKLSDLYIDIIDHVIRYFPMIDVFSIHDDWAGQMNTFFSPAVAEEVIVPAMKKVTDFIHSKGKFADLHSCGQNLEQVPNFIKAGWDSWLPQAFNNIEKIYDLYGDKILIGTMPRNADKNDEEDQRRAAREYVEKYCRKDKPSMLNPNYMLFIENPPHTPVMWEEIYRQSRLAYEK